MFGFLLRVLLIGFVVYLLIGLAFGGYRRICGHYYWMRPTLQAPAVSQSWF